MEAAWGDWMPGSSHCLPVPRPWPQRWEKQEEEDICKCCNFRCFNLMISGTNNSYQVKSSNSLARLYSTSTMEHHHFDQCLMLLNTNGNQLLANVSKVTLSRSNTYHPQSLSLSSPPPESRSQNDNVCALLFLSGSCLIVHSILIFLTLIWKMLSLLFLSILSAELWAGGS